MSSSFYCRLAAYCLLLAGALFFFVKGPCAQASLPQPCSDCQAAAERACCTGQPPVNAMKQLEALRQNSLQGPSELNLSGSWLQDEDLKRLSGLANLQSLCLSSCYHLTDNDLRLMEEGAQSYHNRRLSSLNTPQIVYLKSLQELRTLDLSYCPDLTDSALGHLKGLQHLHELNLNGCSSLRGMGFQALAGLPSLHRLHLRSCRALMEDEFASLASIQSLRFLDLSYCEVLTDELLKKLIDLPELTCLRLQGCLGLTVKGVQAFMNEYERLHPGQLKIE